MVNMVRIRVKFYNRYGKLEAESSISESCIAQHLQDMAFLYGPYYEYVIVSRWTE